MSTKQIVQRILIALALSVFCIALLWVTTSRTAAAPETQVSAVEEGDSESAPPTTTPPQPKSFQYVEVIDSCGAHYAGDCLNVRSGPSSSSSAVTQIRTGAVLRVDGAVQSEGRVWYKIAFDESVRYPERLAKNWYIASDYVRLFEDPGPLELAPGEISSTTKHILVDRSSQMLYAYDGEVLFMKEAVSTGLELTPTPRGSFRIFKKTPTRYMQGPIPGISDEYYDLPGVPWDLYFTEQGAAIHGAYWHTDFGQEHSHGCVNLPLDKARELYEWADLGTPVLVRD